MVQSIYFIISTLYYVVSYPGYAFFFYYTWYPGIIYPGTPWYPYPYLWVGYVHLVLQFCSKLTAAWLQIPPSFNPGFVSHTQSARVASFASTFS